MVLYLPLKKVWFDMTVYDGKVEEYRSLSLFWFKRLVFNWKWLCEFFDYDIDNMTDDDVVKLLTVDVSLNGVVFNDYVVNEITLGYPRSGDMSRRVRYKHSGIKIDNGLSSWGAVPSRKYFVICHGDVIGELPEAS